MQQAPHNAFQDPKALERGVSRRTSNGKETVKGAYKVSMRSSGGNDRHLAEGMMGRCFSEWSEWQWW
jgi:hypothetical protein